MRLLKGRLINVSNRLPVLIRKRAGGIRVERSSGGLATALDAAWREEPGIWIGWAGASQSQGVDQLLAKASRSRSQASGWEAPRNAANSEVSRPRSWS